MTTKLEGEIMGRKKIQIGNITIALGLMGIGFYFLGKNYSNELLQNIRYLWPVLFIILGLEFVFTRLIVRNSEEEVNLTVNVPGIFLLIFFLVISSIPWGNVRNGININIGNDSFNHNARAEDIINFDPIRANGIQSIRLSNSHGAIYYEGVSNSTEFKVRAAITVSAEDVEKAKELIEEAVIISDSNNELNIDTLKTNKASIVVDYYIEGPKNVSLDINHKYGDIAIKDIKGDLGVNSHQGSISISKVEGGLELDTKYSKIDIRDISGGVDILNHQGDISINGVDGDLKLQSKYSKIMVRDIEKNTIIINHQGRIEVSEIKGSLSVDSKYSEVAIKNVASDLTINNHQGDITLKGIGAEATIKSTYSKIECENAKGKVRIDNKQGKVVVVEANESVKINTEFGEIEVIDYRRGLDVTSRDSKILLDTKYQVEDNVSAETTHGSISFKSPTITKGRVDISTNHGRISTNYRISVEESNREKTLKHTFGPENQVIRLSSRNSSIEFRER